ncbi:hypothetical protein [Streptomyces sp. NPDC055107]
MDPGADVESVDGDAGQDFGRALLLTEENTRGGIVALPVPEVGGRPQRWVVAELADAVEWAMGPLDPGDCDRMGAFRAV